MSRSNTHIIKKAFKILGISLLIVIVLAGGLRLYLKSKWVHSMVQSKITSTVNGSINGKFSIKRLKGDLWKDLSLYDVVISREDTLLSLKELHVHYNIWSLLANSFQAQELRLSGLNVNILEGPDSTFNFQELAKTDSTANESSSFTLELQQLLVDEAEAKIFAPSYLPDSTLRLQHVNLRSSLTYGKDLTATLSSLSLNISEGRLPEPISINTAASYDDQTITLNSLLIDTGHSLLEASGGVHLQDSTFNIGAQTDPLSLRDLQPYLDETLSDEKLQLSLQVDGSFEDIRLELQGSGKALQSFQLKTDFSLVDTPTLTALSLSGQMLNLSAFKNDLPALRIAAFSTSLNGNLIQQLENSILDWEYALSGISYEDIQLEEFSGKGTLRRNTLDGSIKLRDALNTVTIHPNINAVFSSRPSWSLPATLSLRSLQNWTPNIELTGPLDLRFNANGQGYSLSDQTWKFQVQRSLNKPHTPFKISGQPFTDLIMNGSLNADSLRAEGFFSLIESRIDFSMDLYDFLSDEPTYTYELRSREFDANELSQVTDFPTSINIRATGNGRYFDPDIMELASSLQIDSSYVNGATFNRLDLETQLQGSILTISKGELVSEVLEGSFTGRKDLNAPSDPGNDLAINLQINNLQPLASLVGTKILNAGGNISGHISQSKNNELQFDGDLELYELVYDTLFTAEQITGQSLITLKDTYGYNLALNVKEPVFKGIGLQDLHFNTKGMASNDSLMGSFSLNIESREAGMIQQSGTYQYAHQADWAQVNWDAFSFETPARTLRLQRSFSLEYEKASIRTDTLWLSSQGGTFMELAIPYADSLTQNIWTRGKDFDFGVVQEILFDQRYVDGVLSGEFKVDRSPETLSGFGALTFSDLSYQGTNVDLLGLRFEIASERLNANLSVSDNGTEQIVGDLDVPFVVADPKSLDDSFFERPVSGKLQVNPLSLSRYKELLKSFQINETDGIFSFNGRLQGTAGTPNMSGQFQLKQPTLSGIPIDSASARFEYDHQQKQILTQAEINTRGQQAALINARIPLSVDFRTFSVNTPGDDDPLDINVETNDFNLSVFNDFLDRRYLAKLRGTLNAEIHITGSLGNLNPDGYLRLAEARVDVPVAGIQISKINSDFSVTKNGLLLKNVSASSGKGSFNAKGLIKLDGITPGNMNLTLKASRFRLANTSDYNLTIDLDSKLTGPPKNPKASGKLTVKNGFIYLQDFGEKSVEDVQLEGEEDSGFSLYDSLAMDMRFVIERNFLIRNRRYLDMEIALTGTLDAQKQARAPLSLFGTLNAQRGYVRPLGKQFNLEEGRFTFSGPIEDPELFIKTSYIPQSSQKQGTPIILYYMIEGTAQDPEFSFESEPSMEQQDIICYTLFNKPCYALESWQQVVSGSSGSSPTDLLVDVLLDEVEALATQQLGIDVVQIDNTRSGSNSGTSIKTGWYLNRRTFFAIVNEISGTTPKTLFILEYLISKDLDLILTQGDDNRQGIDLRWQIEY